MSATTDITAGVLVARDCLYAMATADAAAWEAGLHAEVRFRELTPAGLQTLTGRDEVSEAIGVFTQNAGSYELTHFGAAPAGPRVEVTYGIAGADFRFEMRAFCDVRDGRVVAIDQVCSGRLPA